MVTLRKPKRTLEQALNCLDHHGDSDHLSYALNKIWENDREEESFHPVVNYYIKESADHIETLWFVARELAWYAKHPKKEKRK